MKQLFYTFLLLLLANIAGAQKVDLKIDIRPDAKTFVVMAKPDTTWTGNDALTKEFRVTVVAPTGELQPAALNSLVGSWSLVNSFIAPEDSPNTDYFQFEAVENSRAFSYEKGRELELFTFVNTGGCGGAFVLFDILSDPMYPVNSTGVNLENKLITGGSEDKNTYRLNYDSGLANCQGVSSICLVTYNLQAIPGGKYQVSVLPFVSWPSPQNLTSTMQISLKAPTRSFRPANVQNLIPGVDFIFNSIYIAPPEDPDHDYLSFGLTTNNTFGIEYRADTITPLFTFQNTAECTAGTVKLATLEDPFVINNQENGNVTNQLTTLGSGPDVSICEANFDIRCISGDDADRDGMNDLYECAGNYRQCPDSDGDGFPDWLDEDSDNDGIRDTFECRPAIVQADTIFMCSDFDMDGIEDRLDLDSDDDGILDVLEGQLDVYSPAMILDSLADADRDGLNDAYDPDNGGHDFELPNSDGLELEDWRDIDSDNDNILDMDEKGDQPLLQDTDNNGIPDFRQNDVDGDGVPDNEECPNFAAGCPDFDNDGVPDYKDIDADDDGIRDNIECPTGTNCPDFDRDGIPDYHDLDSDNDGIPDNIEALVDPLNPIPFLGLDRDNDGLDDAFDEVCSLQNDASLSNVDTCATVGFTPGTYLLPPDTDGDGNADYRDINSDGDDLLDEQEGDSNDPDNIVDDTDGDGIADFRDSDASNCDLSNVPSQPFITGPNEACQHNSLTLIANEFTGNTVLYTWTVPGSGDNFIGQGTNQITISNTSIADGGRYMVSVSVNGSCQSSPAIFDVVIKPQLDITATNDAGSCLDNGTPVQLDVTVPGDPNNYTYAWTGPDNFTSSAKNPLIIFTDPFAIVGTYNVQVIESNGCPSLSQTTVSSSANPIAKATSNGDQCLGDPVILKVEAISVEPLSFEWFDGDPDGTPGANFVGEEEELILDDLVADFYTYFVKVNTTSGCAAQTIAKVSFQVIDRPIVSSPMIFSSHCEGERIQLLTEDIPNATYSWFGPDNFTSVAQNPILFPATATQSGIYSVQAVANGCPSEVSEIEIAIVPRPERPIFIYDSPTCNGQDLLLEVFNADPNVSYNWYKDNQLIDGNEAPLSIPNATAELNGTYYVESSIGSCLSSPSNSISIEILNHTNDPAIVSSDISTCLDTVLLQAQEVINGTGVWNTLTKSPDGPFIDNNNSNITIARAIQDGTMMFEWSVSDDICGITSRDTLRVEKGISSSAKNDTITIDLTSDQVFINVLFNDKVSNNIDLTIIEAPEFGTASFDASNNIDYTPADQYFGQDSITYMICDLDCLSDCVTATVYINQSDLECSEIANAFTPNGDGNNDNFIIPCADTYPGSKLTIFNRWGDAVMQTENYSNNWAGTWNKTQLPTGTYFYICEVNNPSGTKLHGFVFLQR